MGLDIGGLFTALAYLEQLMPFVAIVKSLKGVRAHAPETTEESYAIQGAAFLAQRNVAEVVGRMTPDAQAAVVTHMGAFFWALDAGVEK